MKTAPAPREIADEVEESDHNGSMQHDDQRVYPANKSVRRGGYGAASDWSLQYWLEQAYRR